MKRDLFFLTLFFLLLSPNIIFSNHPASGLGADDILGKWYNQEKTSIIEIYKCGDKYCGKVVWLKEPKLNGKEKTDIKNPDKNLQSKPIMGLMILKYFKYDDPEWEEGKIYDPKNGETYSCVIKMKDKNTLDVRGYVGMSMFGRTTVWTRANN